jgi:hypothetical protein
MFSDLTLLEQPVDLDFMIRLHLTRPSDFPSTIGPIRG